MRAAAAAPIAAGVPAALCLGAAVPGRGSVPRCSCPKQGLCDSVQVSQGLPPARELDSAHVPLRRAQRTDMPNATLQVDGMQWWRAVVKGEPEINTQQVEPENSNLADLGE